MAVTLEKPKKFKIIGAEHPHYKWVALSNTTLGMLMATINGSSLIIALPAIFRGIELDPLAPSNFSYLLWILMGYLLVSAVLVVSLGKLGDIFGRVKMYNLGFLVFTLASVLLSLIFSHGSTAALELIIIRIIQGIGGALLMANSAAILTDAFPANQRGFALGINMMAAVIGQFIGLLLGGALASIDWRWVFLINVPIGAVGTVWAYLFLQEKGIRINSKIDYLGNITFAGALTLALIGVTYGIQPYGKSLTGWGNPFVISTIAAGLALLVIFLFIESKTKDPMFRLGLFKNRVFALGSFAGLAASLGQGGLMFLLVMWLQGIWLPLHGYNFSDTPLWGGIYLLPLTFGFLIAGPIAGYLSDRFGQRAFAALGLIIAALSFYLLDFIGADFSYLYFALIVLLNGLSFGLFTAPNTAAIMNSVAPQERGVASGIRVTFRNTGTPLSIGLFFSLMVIGLAEHSKSIIYRSLLHNHVPAKAALHIAQAPPLAYLFSAFLGYNPMKTLLGKKILSSIPKANANKLLSNTYFPHLISVPFQDGLEIVLIFAAGVCIIGAILSMLQGKPKSAGQEQIIKESLDHKVEPAFENA
jgi:EmrB/QacA subfamily drug resistance transporter